MLHAVRCFCSFCTYKHTEDIFSSMIEDMTFGVYSYRYVVVEQDRLSYVLSNTEYVESNDHMACLVFRTTARKSI